jgi:hypothetical protein
MRKQNFNHESNNRIVGHANQNVWIPLDVGPTRISNESTRVPHVGPTLTYCGSRMYSTCGRWMIRSIYVQSNVSLFRDDVA